MFAGSAEFVSTVVALCAVPITRCVGNAVFASSSTVPCRCALSASGSCFLHGVAGQLFSRSTLSSRSLLRVWSWFSVTSCCFFVSFVLWCLGVVVSGVALIVAFSQNACDRFSVVSRKRRVACCVSRTVSRLPRAVYCHSCGVSPSDECPRSVHRCS